MGALRFVLGLPAGVLVERAQKDDSAAFRAIFERHAPEVRRFLFGICGEWHLADEATQETFVRAHKKLGSLRDGDKVVPWLLGIARRVSQEQRRSRRRSRAFIERHERAGVERSEPSPEELLLGREELARAARALDALSEERRAALLLRIDHGLAYEEIAQTMDWSLAKVKNEIHRARLELRARIGSEA
jgi:RNA polymerase sigma-70 factor (ECF subfamily)